MKTIKIRIKTWEEMEQEFGLKYNGEIDVEFTFTKLMEKELPSNRIIEVTPGEVPGEYWWIQGGFYYHISKDMVKEHNLTQLKTLIKSGAFKTIAKISEI